MRHTIFILLALCSLALPNILKAQTIFGTVYDQSNSTPLVGASVLVKGEKKGSFTDANGQFELKLSPGTYEFTVSFVGYESFISKPITLKKGEKKKMNFRLNAAKSLLDEVVVSSYEKERMRPAKVRIRNKKSQGHAPASYPTPKPAESIYYPPMDREGYDHIQENNFKEVSNDPLSTFSIDVDRASYANVRRFLNKNTLPPADAVRIEEMINYFDYNYPQPKGEHPFEIHTEVAKSPWKPENWLLQIGLQGKDLDLEEAPANNLVFLLDVSGSMNYPDKLPLLKQAFKLLVDNMRPQDRVAIAVYAGAAGLVLPSTPGSQKTKILKAIDQLNAGGSTAGGAGIELAYKTAIDNFLPDGNNRVILATDGDFNVGVSSNGELVRLIEKKREAGVFLTVLGFGTGNYQDSKMEQLADKGNGNYAYIDNVLEAKKVLVNEMSGTLFTIAKDVKLQIEFNPQKIKGYRLIGYENRLLNKEDFNDDTKDAGELGAGHTVTALYELIPADEQSTHLASVDPLKYQEVNTTSAASSDELMTIKLRYKAPKEDKSKLLVHTLHEQKVQSIDKASTNLKLSSSVAEMGMLLRDSSFKEGSSFESLIQRANQAKGADPDGYRAEFIRLAKIASLIK